MDRFARASLPCCCAVALLSAGSAWAQEPSHYVVIEGREGAGSSDYTIQTTTDRIDKVSGTFHGVDVTTDDADTVSGSQITGTVWAAADGYRIYGAIKQIDIAGNADNVIVHTGPLGAEAPEGCRKQITVDTVEVLSGQGAGEGQLELQIDHNTGVRRVHDRVWKVPPGTEQVVQSNIATFRIQPGETISQNINVQVEEVEVGSDWFTGQNDEGSSTMTVDLECGRSRTVSQKVSIGSDRGNPGELRVNYRIQDAP